MRAKDHMDLTIYYLWVRGYTSFLVKDGNWFCYHYYCWRSHKLRSPLIYGKFIFISTNMLKSLEISWQRIHQILNKRNSRRKAIRLVSIMYHNKLKADTFIRRIHALFLATELNQSTRWFVSTLKMVTKMGDGNNFYNQLHLNLFGSLVMDQIEILSLRVDARQHLCTQSFIHLNSPTIQIHSKLA